MPAEPAAGLLVYRVRGPGAPLEVLLCRLAAAARRPARTSAGEDDEAGERGRWSLPLVEAPLPEIVRPAPRGWESVPLRGARKPRLRAASARDELLMDARRELARLTGLAPTGPFMPLGGVKMRGHRLVLVWAVRDDEAPFAAEPAELGGASGVGPGERYERVAFVSLARARARIAPPQRRFLDDLAVLAGGALG